MSHANKIYIGNLNPRATERDIEDEFGRFGKLINVWVARKPPGTPSVDSFPAVTNAVFALVRASARDRGRMLAGVTGKRSRGAFFCWG